MIYDRINLNDIYDINNITIYNPNNPYLANEILEEIVLNTTDINTLKQLYVSNKLINGKLSDTKFLRILANNILNSISTLPRSTRTSSNVKGSWRLNESELELGESINNIDTFKDFVEWYETNFYTDDCSKYNNSVICYSGALTANDNDKVQYYLNQIETDLDTWKSHEIRLNISYIPLEHILNLIRSITMNESIIDYVIIKALQRIQDLYEVKNVTLYNNDIRNVIELIDIIDNNNNTDNNNKI